MMSNWMLNHDEYCKLDEEALANAAKEIQNRADSMILYNLNQEIEKEYILQLCKKHMGER